MSRNRSINDDEENFAATWGTVSLGTTSDDDITSPSTILHDDDSWLELDDLVPLSIEAPGGYNRDDENRPPRSVSLRRLQQIRMILTERVQNCYCCNRRYLIGLIFIILCLIGSALLVLRELFHQSIPNLLHTPHVGLFGGDKHSTTTDKAQQMEPVCLNSELLGAKNRRNVEDINFDRVATAFYEQLIGDDNMLASGFLWDDEDASTAKWRPQGLTTMHTSNGMRFALISWYGRMDEGYANRGGRISFVDLTDMPIDEYLTKMPRVPFFKYQHVLLVDQNLCTLTNIHAGGIEYQNGILYVADSRKGQQSIIEFDVTNDLYASNDFFSSEINKEVPSLLFEYQYVLRASSSFHTPIKPSFLSYDIDNQKFIVGTYAKCGKERIHMHEDTEECMSGKNNNLLWFDRDNVNLTSPAPCEHYFPEMQGAVSVKNHDKTVIWTSSSYGAVLNSHLHTFRTTQPIDRECPEILEQNTYLFPPGLEDLHIEDTISPRNRFMWMQTEFGTRQVFAVPLGQLLRRL